MLRLLGRRWWGVSGWLYLVSLILAWLMYWMLPMHHQLHEWSFPGAIRFAGFTKDHQRLVISNQQPDGILFHHLNLRTGACTTYRAMEHSDQELDQPSVLKKADTLILEGSINDERSTTLMLHKADSSRLALSCTTKQTIVLPGGASREGAFRYSENVSTHGFQATSDNGQWFIISLGQAEVEPWQAPWHWLQKKLSWKLTSFQAEWRFSAMIFDLQGNQAMVCPLHSRSQPMYAIHPNGLGFAVLDNRVSGSTTTTNVLVPGTTSFISWYGLPTGVGYHSLPQWCIIIGVFAVPVLMSMLLNLFRNRRVARNLSLQP